MCYTRHINSTVIKSFVCSFSIAHKAFYITRLNTYIQYIHISIFVFILWAAISFPCCRCNYILLSSSIFSTLFYPISVFVQRSSIECLQNFKFTKTRLKQKKNVENLIKIHFQFPNMNSQIQFANACVVYKCHVQFYNAFQHCGHSKKPFSRKQTYLLLSI